MAKYEVLYSETIYGGVVLEVPDSDDVDDEVDAVLEAFYSLPRPVIGLDIESELNDNEINKL